MKALKTISNVLMGVLIVAAIISISAFLQSRFSQDKIPGIGDCRFFSVLSGSMDPTFKVYDMIVDKKVDTNQLKPGDVITFKDGQSLITHRIVKIVGKGSQFITKGDANNTQDETPVDSKNVISKYLFKLPYMGLVISKLKGPLGIIIMWSIFALAVLSEIFSKKYKKRQRRKNRLVRRKEILEENNNTF